MKQELVLLPPTKAKTATRAKPEIEPVDLIPIFNMPGKPKKKAAKKKPAPYAKVLRVLSYGGGVDSAALLLWAYNNRNVKPVDAVGTVDVYPFDLVLFADTGDELPSTKETVAYYKKWCEDRNIPFMVVKNKYGKSLEQYMLDKNIFASRRRRDCTTKFKIAPKRAYLRATYGKDVRFINYIGYEYNEQGRVDKANMNPGVAYEDCEYPLYNLGLTRQDCIEYIKKCGEPVPEKSGCFHCPFTKKCGWVKLYLTHKDLYDRAMFLEENSKEYKKGTYLSSKPLRVIAGQIKAMTPEEIEEALNAERIGAK